MNINLRDVICTSRDGDRFWKLPECYIRGNTIKYIVNLLKEYQVKKIFIAISSPKIINTNHYGIDIPTKEELLCFQKTNQEIEKDLSVEKIIFQDLNDLKQSVQSFEAIQHFELSVFQP